MLKIKLFDENHEKDLEEEMNLFITSNMEKEIKDIKYQVAVTKYKDDEIYCFSAMIIYEEVSNE